MICLSEVWSSQTYTGCLAARVACVCVQPIPAFQHRSYSMMLVPSLGWLRRVWLGWVFVVVCSLDKTTPNPRENICCGKNRPKMPRLTVFFFGLGWPLGWGVRRSYNNFGMFSNATEFGKSQTPYYVMVHVMPNYTSKTV